MCLYAVWFGYVLSNDALCKTRRWDTNSKRPSNLLFLSGTNALASLPIYGEQMGVRVTLFEMTLSEGSHVSFTPK